MKSISSQAIRYMHAMIVFTVIACVVNGILITTARADWRDLFDAFKESASPKHKGQLSSTEIVAGLKEALRVGTRKSIDVLGKQDGFYKDKSVKIPMPDKLRQVDRLLRNLGQKKLAEKFIKTMNRAAEKSVQSTVDIFVSAIKQMTLKDAVDIYKGREDEATRYFQKTKGKEIHKTIHPIVQEATAQTGVTSTYKKIARKIRSIHPSLAKNMPDIDNYVTEKTMDGIFRKLAKEEALIRKDPAARTTEILKKVFSQ